MAANTSSFAIIFALCMMAVDRAGMGADRLLSAAAQIRKPQIDPQLMELAGDLFDTLSFASGINALESTFESLLRLHSSITAGIRAAHARKLGRTNSLQPQGVFEGLGQRERASKQQQALCALDPAAKRRARAAKERASKRSKRRAH